MIFMLAACDSAGRAFRGVPAQYVDVEGLSFAVRVKGTEAEAIRTNRMARPQRDQIGLAAQRAMELVSGCEVRQLTGDVAVMTATLRCRDGP
ncbi:hypothetical protein [Thalassobius sp. MITS945101]|uniref:hypothetical protein n=1 Tax=Thalassobius sp. MITS945101 TaxID=3096994 RepID=UPI00399B48EC